MGKLKRALPLLLALTLCLGTSNLTAFAADNSDVDTDATTKSEQATTLTKDEVSDEDNPSKDDATLQTDNETNGETDGDENEDTTIGEDELNGTAPQNVETEDEAALTDAGEDTPDENSVAKVGDVGFASVQDAIDAAQEGDTVTLLESTTESITVAAGQNITLNIPAGITLTNTENKHTITVAEGATLTIEGQGTVDNVSDEKTVIYNEGTTTLNGCTYDRSQEAGKDNKDDGGNSCYFIMNLGTMTINDGVSAQSKGGFSSMVLNGRRSDDGSISIPANLTINGGTLINGNTAVKNERGTVIINDGEIASLTHGYSVVNYDTVELKGGNYVKSDKYAIWTAPGTTLTISGGIFAAPVKAEYCAEGYIPTENADGTYGVVKDPSTEPVDPVDPVDPVNPVDPVDPVNPDPDPVEPTEPVNPTDPATPTPGTNPQDRTPVIPSTTPTPTRTNLPAANNNAGEDATNPAIEEVTPDDAIPLASGLADDANDSKETTLDEDGTPLANAPTSTGSILPWILTGIIVVIAAAGLLWFLIAKRRKDDEEETPAHA